MAIKKIVTSDVINIYLASYQFKKVVNNKMGLSAIELGLLLCSCVSFKNGIFNKKRLWHCYLGNTPHTHYLNTVFNKLYDMGYYVMIAKVTTITRCNRISASYRVSESGFDLIARFEALLLKEANKLRDVDFSFKNGNEKKKVNKEALKTFNDY